MNPFWNNSASRSILYENRIQRDRGMRYSELHLPQQRVDYHRKPAISEARPKDLPILPRQDKRAVG
jgi:hypothetical protein